MNARGELAEGKALAFLQDQGLELIARNFRCRIGELDLVMRDDDAVVVAEVRYRASVAYGTAAESVDWRKQRKLVAAAGLFLQRHPRLASMPVRFDVVAVTPGDGDDRFEWIREAFAAG